MAKLKRKKKSKKQKNYLLVSEDVASETHLKVARVKDRLAQDAELSIYQACKEENVSRSAYYKYREDIHRYALFEDKKIYHYFFELIYSPAFMRNLTEILGENVNNIQRSSQERVSSNRSVLHLSLWLNNPEESQNLLQQFKLIRGVRRCKLYKNLD